MEISVCKINNKFGQPLVYIQIILSAHIIINNKKNDFAVNTAHIKFTPKIYIYRKGSSSLRTQQNAHHYCICVICYNA